jgi:hypothetical protein
VECNNDGIMIQRWLEGRLTSVSTHVQQVILVRVKVGPHHLLGTKPGKNAVGSRLGARNSRELLAISLATTQ